MRIFFIYRYEDLVYSALAIDILDNAVIWGLAIVALRKIKSRVSRVIAKA